MDLSSYIKESLLDDLEDLERDSDNTIEKTLIEKFLKENYNIRGNYTIKDGVVDVKGNVIVKNKKINNLTNDIFEFGIIIGVFCCADCRQLTSLKGAPKKVSGSFECSECPQLTSLEGAPEEVGGSFYCHDCSSLTSLEGAPKKVHGNFNCSWCNSLTSLEGAPRYIGKDLYCACCKRNFYNSNDISKLRLKTQIDGNIYGHL